MQAVPEDAPPSPIAAEPPAAAAQGGEASGAASSQKKQRLQRLDTQALWTRSVSQEDDTSQERIAENGAVQEMFEPTQFTRHYSPGGSAEVHNYLFPGLCRRADNIDELWVGDDEDDEGTRNLELHGHSFVRGSSGGAPSFTRGSSGDGKDHHVAIQDEATEKKAHAAAGAGHGGGHEHHEKDPSIVAAFASGVINFLLMFGLCCAYSLITFSDEWNGEHRGIGVKMHVGSAFFAGAGLALFSDIPVAIGGPDLNPVVFIGLFCSTIAKEVADDLGLPYPDVEIALRRRRLAGESSSGDDGFCVGYEKYLNVEHNSTLQAAVDAKACEDYHQQLRATSLFTVAMSTLIFAGIFFILGKFKFSGYISYIPSSIMEAFLACVGWKVFSYAIKFCQYEAWQFVPACIVGVGMYIVKAAHIGNPAIAIPAILLIPLACFHIYVLATGKGVEGARDDELMFPLIEDASFYQVWTEGLGNFEKINWPAYAKTLPDIVTMIIVVLLDCLLKVSATESKLPVKYSIDHELQIDGLINIVNSLFCTSVGYMQLKFNVINYGIIGNVSDRRAGLIYAFFMGIAFFGWHGLINYLPRFFLSALLFFAGAGFVADNLWGSRLYLSFFEWGQIIIIVAVFVLSGQLYIAVIVGFVMVCIDFLYNYAQVSTLKGGVHQGGSFATIQRYDPIVHFNMEHVMDHWLLVVQMKGFVFFASAQRLKNLVHERLRQQLDLPQWRRAKFLIFDCELLDGLDASAAKAVRTLAREAASLGLACIWCSLSKMLRKNLLDRSVVTEEGYWYPSFQSALLWVEQCVLEHLAIIQQRWLSVHKVFETYHQQLEMQRNFEPFGSIYTRHITAAVARSDPWQYCKRLSFNKGDVLWKVGQEQIGLYVVHRGTVGLFDETPSSESLKRPLYIYRHGWFMNIQAMTKGRPHFAGAALEEVEVVVFGERDLIRMVRGAPVMYSLITKVVMKQQVFEEQLLNRQQQTSSLHRKASQVHYETELDASRPWEVTTQFFALPHTLTQRLRGVHAAEALGQFGVFDRETEPQTCLRPEMPPTVQAHIRKAFNSCAKPQIEQAKANGTGLSVHLVRHTLFYAGVFDATLPEHLEGTDMTEDDFLRLVTKVLMAPLSPQQQEVAKGIFTRFDTDNSGALDRDQTAELFRVLAPSISAEALEGIHTAYARGNEAGIGLVDFNTLLSRFARAHELDWALLQALRVLGGDGNMESYGQEPGSNWRGRATPESLRAMSPKPLTKDEAEEMLWVMDWHTHGAGGGQSLGLDGVVSAVFMALPEADSLTPNLSRQSVEEHAILFNAGEAGTSFAINPSAAGEEQNMSCMQLLHTLLCEPGTWLSWDLFQVAFLTSYLLLLVVEPILAKEHPSRFDSTSARGVWLVLEVVYAVIFTVELVLRVLAMRWKLRNKPHKFWSTVLKNGLLWADLCAIVPTYVDLIVDGWYWHFAFGLLKAPRLMTVFQESHFGQALKKSSLVYPSMAVLIIAWGIYLAEPEKK